VNALGELAFALMRLGYPDQALSRCQASVTLARKVSHPLSLAYSLVVSGAACCERGDWHLARERAEEALAVSTQGGFAQFIASPKAVKGWALAGGLGDQEGLVLAQQGLDELRALGAEWLCQMLGSVMAELYGRLGKPEAGLALVASLPPEEVKSPDTFRIEGELLLRLSAPDEARVESLFRDALGAARKQDARLWELRATTALARLLAKQGHRDEARPMLAEIYNWFTEGFDTADLKDAKALLEELSG
jgi:predicted ATPase